MEEVSKRGPWGLAVWCSVLFVQPLYTSKTIKKDLGVYFKNGIDTSARQLVIQPMGGSNLDDTYVSRQPTQGCEVPVGISSFPATSPVALLSPLPPPPQSSGS